MVGALYSGAWVDAVVPVPVGLINMPSNIATINSGAENIRISDVFICFPLKFNLNY